MERLPKESPKQAMVLRQLTRQLLRLTRVAKGPEQSMFGPCSTWNPWEINQDDCGSELFLSEAKGEQDAFLADCGMAET